MYIDTQFGLWCRNLKVWLVLSRMWMKRKLKKLETHRRTLTFVMTVSCVSSPLLF